MFWASFWGAVLFWGSALAGGLYWTRRYVRAVEAGAKERLLIAELEARVRALEGRTDAPALTEGAAPLRELAPPTDVRLPRSDGR